jgi:3',5'-cyclic-AMP phosphodiesterase
VLVIAHVSDVHFDGSDRNIERSARVMEHINALRQPVDVVLVTGDIADHGRASEYEEAAKVLTSPQPLLMCPGNHDARGPYREVLLHQPSGDGPINAVHRVGGAVFAMCDSSVPGRNDGYLDDETFAWLEGVVADAGDAPVFICFHHPPVLLYSPFLDSIRQRGEERLADLVRRSPQVVALLCGHAHTAAATTFAGRPLLVAPGVVSTLRLPWEWEDVIDYSLPPAFAFHVLDDERRLTTHYRVVP